MNSRNWIAESDTPEAQEVIADAEPVAETADASITVAGNVADVVVVVELEEETKSGSGCCGAHGRKPLSHRPGEKLQDAVCAGRSYHASAPMTRAPAPEYVPETPHHSDWQRPSSTLKVKAQQADIAPHVSPAPR